MGTFAALLQAIIALPKLLDFMKEFATFLKNTFGDNAHKWLADAGPIFKQLNAAKTQEEKYAAGKSLQDLIGRLGN